MIVPHGLWIDHIIPRAKKGTDESANLCVSCVSCNLAKGSMISARDPVTRRDAPLFNPRKDSWDDHFRWSSDQVLVEGLTPTGRATIVALKMNSQKIIELRRLLIRLNVHAAQ
ncbi:HNH endonuclease [candidate division KSB1 bacterium]|nr:HNH endonuclease [candidate division KSB1 bacterium]